MNRPEPSTYVTTRPATDDDVPAIARIWHEGWVVAHVGHVSADLVAERTPSSFIPRTHERVRHTWVAEQASRVLGFVVVLSPEIEQIYVDATARGTGVARRLLRLAEDLVRDAGHDRAWLAVVAGNERARRFYAREGWTDTGPYRYAAEGGSGTIFVQTHRYEIELNPHGS
jgi:putative acetyltransferase